MLVPQRGPLRTLTKDDDVPLILPDDVDLVVLDENDVSQSGPSTSVRPGVRPLSLGFGASTPEVGVPETLIQTSPF